MEAVTIGDAPPKLAETVEAQTWTMARVEANTPLIANGLDAPETEPALGVEQLRALLRAVDVLLQHGLVDQARVLLRPLLGRPGAADGEVRGRAS